jgi:membrane protein DedA with SNARE-associated domain
MIHRTVNETFFLELCDTLSGHPWLQWLLIIAGTCFIEDPARCGVVLLVAGGHIRWWTAFPAMVIGGVVGDVGLYFIGRYATDLLVRLRWVDPARLSKMKEVFYEHAVKSLFIARFLPGARGITYSVSGIVRYPFLRLLAVLTAASAIQALLFLKLGDFVGETVIPYLKRPQMRVVVVAAVVLGGVLVHQKLARRRRRKVAALAAAEAPPATPPPES